MPYIQQKDIKKYLDVFVVFVQKFQTDAIFGGVYIRMGQFVGEKLRGHFKRNFTQRTIALPGTLRLHIFLGEGRKTPF